MRRLIPLMERTLAAFSTGAAVQPLRPVVPVDPHRGFLSVMPAYLVTQEAIGLKAVSVYPDNPSRGLPSHLATILLMDAQTGVLLAVMDGRLITEMRTAAVSAAVTAKLAARPPRAVALLGAGVQARSHLEALREVAVPHDVRVWSRTRDGAERFAAETRERLGLHVTVAASPADAVRGADVVCTVTSSRTPVLEGAWLEPGLHINAVGAARPDWQELDVAAVSRSRVFVDSRASAVAEAGDLVVPLQAGALAAAHIQAEVGEVFAGLHPGRTAADEITLFESVGLAVEDVATAKLAYEDALARGIGGELSLT
jgi:alanine dehydrogenase